MSELLERVRTVVDGVLASSTADQGPDEDQHSDPTAEVGDKRVYVRPMGELFNYDGHHADQIIVERQTYRANVWYTNGNTGYGWMSDRTLFRGTVDEWRAKKDNPRLVFEDDVPLDWEKIVDHVDRFIDIHGEELKKPEYPHGVLRL